MVRIDFGYYLGLNEVMDLPNSLHIRHLSSIKKKRKNDVNLTQTANDFIKVKTEQGIS